MFLGENKDLQLDGCNARETPPILAHDDAQPLDDLGHETLPLLLEENAYSLAPHSREGLLKSVNTPEPFTPLASHSVLSQHFTTHLAALRAAATKCLE